MDLTSGDEKSVHLDDRDLDYLADFIPYTGRLSEAQAHFLKDVHRTFPKAKVGKRGSHGGALFYYGLDPEIGVYSGPIPVE